MTIAEKMGNEYIEKAKHCIGFGHRKPYTRHGKQFYRPYRNYYSTGCEDENWDVMVLAGYATRGEQNSHGGYTFCLTRLGLDWLGKELGVTIHDEED